MVAGVAAPLAGVAHAPGAKTAVTHLKLASYHPGCAGSGWDKGCMSDGCSERRMAPMKEFALALSAMTASHHQCPMKPLPELAPLVQSAPPQARYVDVREL